MTDIRLIDANELKKRFSNEPYGPEEIRGIIDNAPTVNLEKTSFMKGYNYGCDDGKRFYARPKGEWVNNECPFCGRYENYPENFCATCGADLRGKEE